MNNGENNCLLEKLARAGENGSTYVNAQTLFRQCKWKDHAMTHERFETMLAEQVQRNMIHPEGNRLYLEETWQSEETAARCLSDILLSEPLAAVKLPETVRVGDAVLFDEQKKAAETALSNRLSCIVGSAGSGKSTLIRAILNQSEIDESRCVLCAPTGKAAQNLRQKTGVGKAQTIHRALKLRCSSTALTDNDLANAGLVIVDESSMLTIELMAKLLDKTGEDCRIVLLGDPNQLPGIGAGNILPDLRRIGIPFSFLKSNHRQNDTDSALFYNVSRFESLRDVSDLRFDDSFVFRETDGLESCRQITEEAAYLYRTGESVQVLSPLRSRSALSVAELNRRLQEELNPAAPEKAFLAHDENEFRDGDPVMITMNSMRRNCFNGEVGRFEKLTNGFRVLLPDGRAPYWAGRALNAGLAHLQLAYAMTVHKAQGSEFDTVLVALPPDSGTMLGRSLLYTAITRAKRHVILYGATDTLVRALRTDPQPRASGLTEKTLRLAKACA